MDKLEQLHFEAITEAEFSNYSGHSEGQEVAAIKSAEITEQIAGEFAEWLPDNGFTCYDDDSTEITRVYWVSFLGKYKDKEFSSKEVFQEFLKTKQ